MLFFVSGQHLEMDHMVDLMSVIKINTFPGRMSTFQRTCIVGIGVIIQISCFLFRNWGMFIMLFHGFFSYFFNPRTTVQSLNCF